MILIKFILRKEIKLMSSLSCLNQICRSQTFMDVHFLTGRANNIIKIFQNLLLIRNEIELIVNFFYTILIKINVSL